jgi:hypothetical protein
MATRLVKLEVKNVAAVGRPANKRKFLIVKSADMQKSWTTAEINDLPDSSFAVISAGGKKDDDGKTVPRNLRHLPYKDASGKVDLPHLRNALARMNQIDASPEEKARARAKLLAAAKEAGVGAAAEKSDDPAVAEAYAEILELVKMEERKMTDQKKPDAKALSRLGHSIAALFGKAAGADDDTIKELEKQAGDEPIVEIPDVVKAALAKADADAAELRKSNEELKARLDKAEATTKAASDEAAKLREEADLRKFADEVSGFKDVGLDPTKDATILKAVEEKVGKDAADRLREIFKAQLAQKNASGLMRELGSKGSTVTPDSAAAIVEAKIDEVLTKNDKLDRAAAMNQVFTADPGLYARYRQETNVRV